MPEGLTIEGSAEFNADTPPTHRKRLDRWWGSGPRALVCMANPSTAGATDDDPTIRRLVDLLHWRCDGFTVVNWETYISPSPAQMFKWRNFPALYEMDEARAENLDLIADLTKNAPLRIVAWGNIVPQVPQTTRILRAMSLGFTVDLHAFGLTKEGHPKHPMARGNHRIKNDADLVVWQQRHAS